MKEVTSGRLLQVIEGSPELVDQVAAPHRAAVGGAGLDAADRLDMTQGFGDLLRRPGAHPAQPDHAGLHALLPQVRSTAFRQVLAWAP